MTDPFLSGARAKRNRLIWINREAARYSYHFNQKVEAVECTVRTQRRKHRIPG